MLIIYGTACVQTVLGVDESLHGGQLQMTEQHFSQLYSNYINHYGEPEQAVIKKCETFYVLKLCIILL